MYKIQIEANCSIKSQLHDRKGEVFATIIGARSLAAFLASLNNVGWIRTRDLSSRDMPTSSLGPSRGDALLYFLVSMVSILNNTSIGSLKARNRKYDKNNNKKMVWALEAYIIKIKIM